MASRNQQIPFLTSRAPKHTVAQILARAKAISDQLSEIRTESQDLADKAGVNKDAMKEIKVASASLVVLGNQSKNLTQACQGHVNLLHSVDELVCEERSRTSNEEGLQSVDEASIKILAWLVRNQPIAVQVLQSLGSNLPQDLVEAISRVSEAIPDSQVVTEAVSQAKALLPVQEENVRLAQDLANVERERDARDKRIQELEDKLSEAKLKALEVETKAKAEVGQYAVLFKEAQAETALVREKLHQSQASETALCEQIEDLREERAKLREALRNTENGQLQELEQLRDKVDDLRDQRARLVEALRGLEVGKTQASNAQRVAEAESEQLRGKLARSLDLELALHAKIRQEASRRTEELQKQAEEHQSRESETRKHQQLLEQKLSQLRRREAAQEDQLQDLHRKAMLEHSKLGEKIEGLQKTVLSAQNAQKKAERSDQEARLDADRFQVWAAELKVKLKETEKLLSAERETTTALTSQLQGHALEAQGQEDAVKSKLEDLNLKVSSLSQSNTNLEERRLQLRRDYQRLVQNFVLKPFGIEANERIIGFLSKDSETAVSQGTWIKPWRLLQSWCHDAHTTVPTFLHANQALLALISIHQRDSWGDSKALDTLRALQDVLDDDTSDSLLLSVGRYIFASLSHAIENHALPLITKIAAWQILWLLADRWPRVADLEFLEKTEAGVKALCRHHSDDMASLPGDFAVPARIGELLLLIPAEAQGILVISGDAMRWVAQTNIVHTGVGLVLSPTAGITSSSIRLELGREHWEWAYRYL